MTYVRKCYDLIYYVYIYILTTDMSIVIVFVKYNGRWDENNVYIENDSLGVLIPMSTSYADLLEILFEALELNP